VFLVVGCHLGQDLQSGFLDEVTRPLVGGQHQLDLLAQWLVTGTRLLHEDGLLARVGGRLPDPD
jgi:hypothetical protein